jgi:uncharacterized membrane protein YoaK (UPF0700 family)
MLFREGEARTQSIDLRLAALLSSLAGALNATGFEEVGLFSANMTGNVSALADHLAGGLIGPAMHFLAVVAVFILGAGLAGACIQLGQRYGLRGIYAYLILVEGAALGALAIAAITGGALASGLPLIFGLSFILGWQNAVTTRISSARVRTTHVSGMATDLGLGLSALLFQPGRRAAARAQISLHGVTILSFLFGGFAGAILHHGYAPGPFLVGSVALTLLAISELGRRGAKG